MTQENTEICNNCGREINPSEQAYVFNGMIVCGECDQKLREDVESDLYKPEEQEKERTSHNGKKFVLALSGFIVLAACVVLYLSIFNNERSDNQAGKVDLRDGETISQVEEIEPKGWPFVTAIPEGFEFEQRKVWEGRTIWILKGSRFGQARKTIIVVRSTPQTRGDDIMRASYWAAELSVGLSIAESQRGQKGAAGDEEIKMIGLPVSGDTNQMVMLFCPTGKKIKPKKKEPPTRTAGGFTLPPIQELPDFSSPKILLAELGKPEDFVPGGLSAWAGWSEGTLLLAACASEAKDFGISSGQYGPMLAKLCHNLSDEPGEKYEAPDSTRDILKEVVPEGYTFAKRRVWADMTLWLFKGEKLGEVQETLIAVRWKDEESSPMMLSVIAQKHCCQWAAESSVNKKLSALKASLPKSEKMGYVVKDENGQYELSHPFVHTVESTKEDGEEDKERSFSLSLKDLLAIGEQKENVHCISFDVSDKPGGDTPVCVSAVSRAVSLEAGGFMVFAGATEGTPDKFWHITQTVDNFTDDWVRIMRPGF